MPRFAISKNIKEIIFEPGVFDLGKYDGVAVELEGTPTRRNGARFLAGDTKGLFDALMKLNQWAERG